MTNMQTVDVDKIVEIARRHASRNRWCAEVENVLQEAGLVGEPTYKDLSVTIPLKEFEFPSDVADPVSWFKQKYRVLHEPITAI